MTIDVEEVLRKYIRERASKPVYDPCGEDAHTKAQVFDTYPVVRLEELPWADDNIFHVGEELTINVGIRDMTAGKPAPVIPIPKIEVFVRRPDGMEISGITNEDGKVMLTPDIEGRWSFSIPVFGVAPMFNVVK